MTASAQPDHPFAAPDRMAGATEPLPVTVLDGEALLPGPRGPVGVTVSVRLFDTIEIWLYAAECTSEQPARGLWRWRKGRWETLCGSQWFDPRMLADSLGGGDLWVKLPPAPHDDQVRGLLSLAGRSCAPLHGTQAETGARC